MVVLDTDVVIDFLHGDKKIIEKIREYSTKESTAITSVTLYELLKTENEKSLRQVYDFINNIEVYNLGMKEAIETSKLFKTLKIKGKLIGENDVMIAGITLSNDQILITEDESFENIGSKSIVIIES